MSVGVRGRPRVNASCPVARGLLGLWPGINKGAAIPSSYSNGEDLSSVSGSGGSWNGLGYTFPGGSDSRFVTAPTRLKINPPTSVAICFTSTGNGATNSSFGVNFGGGTPPFDSNELARGASGAVIIQGNSANSQITTPSTAGAALVGRVNVAVTSLSSAERVINLNGRDVATGAAVTSITYGAAQVWVFADFGATVHWFAMWNRALTRSEVSWLACNPSALIAGATDF